MPEIILPAAFILVISAYGLRCRQLIKSRGLDPALITYASPLSLKKFNSGRILIGFSILLIFLNHITGRLGFYFILIASLLQLVLLFSFSRQQTQPYAYYILSALLSTVLLWHQSLLSLIISIVLFIVMELYLSSWNKHSKRRYDAWVASLAVRLNSKYQKIAKGMAAREWGWVLHIATTEQIARPPIVRLAERVYYLLRRPVVISTGIMQVAAPKPISNYRSMELGSEIVRKTLTQMPPQISDHNDQLNWMAKHYNGSFSYSVYLRATDSGIKNALDVING